jgi:L-seryl-tRNA(Ser) seleniumtransferase
VLRKAIANPPLHDLLVTVFNDPEPSHAAWVDASRHFVNLLELQDRVGERIARLVGVEAAPVTTGAAGALLLGTAAAVTCGDRNARRVGAVRTPPHAVPVFRLLRCPWDQGTRPAGRRRARQEPGPARADVI